MFRRMILCLFCLFPLLGPAALAEDKLVAKDQFPGLAKKIEAIRHWKSVTVELVYRLDPELQLFKGYQLLDIIAADPGMTGRGREPLLEHFVLPDGGVLGLFAYDGKNLLYLSQQKETVRKLLQDQKTVGDPKIDLNAFARVLSKSLLDRRNVQYHLVSSGSDISNFEQQREFLSGYKVDSEKLKSVEKSLAPPQWTDQDGEKILTCYYLSGWMHEINQVNKVVFRFSKDGTRLEVQDEVIAEKIFKKVPMIMY